MEYVLNVLLAVLIVSSVSVQEIMYVNDVVTVKTKNGNFLCWNNTNKLFTGTLITYFDYSNKKQERIVEYESDVKYGISKSFF
ncbi:MAG: hypothetical protein LBI72_07600 [Flavobacteriaceae bacterium]|jgi:hypothetical protein|nr:hypothetical protein [Flavobacteriaceae bacterium]